MMHIRRFSVLLLAGHRNGTDPICSRFNIRYKSLAPVGGQPMILYPMTTLCNSESIAEVIVLTQEPDIIKDTLTEYRISPKVHYCKSGNSIAMTLLESLRSQQIRFPLLVTTADNCLLGEQHLEHFLTQSMEQACDVAIGFARRQELLADYPESKRTWIQFQDAALTGCNLFLFKSEQALEAVRYWKEFESTPKKIMKIARALGPVFLWRFWRRQSSVESCFQSISNVAGATVVPVIMANPEVAIDADKLSDIRQIEALLGERRRMAKNNLTASVLDRPLVIFDLDRTITTFGTYTPFLLYYALRRRPLALLSAPVVILCLMACALKLINRKQLKSIIFGLLAGSPARTELTECCTGFVDRTLREDVYVEAIQTINTWRRKGAKLVLATASYDWMADIFARRMGFDQVVATRSIEKDGCILPGVDGENCYGDQKLAMLSAIIGPLAKIRVSGQRIWFYTDHHTDICLLEQCDHPVAVNPTRKLKRWANDTARATILDWHASAKQVNSQTEFLPSGGTN